MSSLDYYLKDCESFDGSVQECDNIGGVLWMKFHFYLRRRRKRSFSSKRKQGGVVWTCFCVTGIFD